MLRKISVLSVITIIFFICASFFIQCKNSRQKEPRFSVLVFSKTAGYHHRSIPFAIAAIQNLGAEHSFAVDTTVNPEYFTDDNLKKYNVVVFGNTTGDVLNDEQQEAFKRYIESGKGFAGIHSAADTEYDWEWYGGLIGGAYFRSHPKGTPDAELIIEDRSHPSTKMLPDIWQRTDEWYNFVKNPRAKVHVLASLNEKSYEGGDMGDHPIIWYRMYDGGRAWYTGLGHTSEEFQDPVFLEHLLGGLIWAAGVIE